MITSINPELIQVLSLVDNVEKYLDYKAVTLDGGGLDFTSFIWKGDTHLGSVSWGFDYAIHTFDLKTFVDAGTLESVIS